MRSKLILNKKSKSKKLNKQRKSKKKMNGGTKNYYKISFDTNMSRHDDVNQELMEKLVEWYKSSSHTIHCVHETTNIVYVGLNQLRIEMIIETSDLEGTKDVMEMIVSPDSDGNHPIEYNGNEYLISGNETQALDSLVPVYLYKISFETNMSRHDEVNKELMEKVVQWYKLSSHTIGWVHEPTNIINVELNQLMIEMIIETSDLEGTKDVMEMIVSPDSDGNHPI